MWKKCTCNSQFLSNKAHVIKVYSAPKYNWDYSKPELKFLNILWGLGTEYE